MSDKVEMIFGLFAGLAIFIFGMNMMSECLQKAAGEKMRTILSMLTGNPVLGVVAGAVTTAVLQSSDAKRTAVAHSVFNISGAFLFIWLVKPYAALIRYISPRGNEVDVISRQIANAHTGFNLVMTLLWLPLIGVLVQIVMRIIPERADRQEVLLPSAPQFLDGRLIGQPTAALHLATKEVLRCSGIVEKMLEKIREHQGDGEETVLAQVMEYADTEHVLYGHINDYFAAMFAEGVMTETQANESAGLMYVLCDIDRMGTLCRDITEAVLSQDGKWRLSKEARKDLRKSIGLILDMYTYVVRMMSGDGGSMDYVQEKREEIRKLDEKMRRAHIERVGKKKCRVELTGLYDSILHNIDRMANSCVNLADTAADSVNLRRLLVDG